MDINSTEMEHLTHEKEKTVNIGCYCYYYEGKEIDFEADSIKPRKSNHKIPDNERNQIILCKIINFTSSSECLIVDLVNMKQYIVETMYLSLIQDHKALKEAKNLNKQYLKTFDNINNKSNVSRNKKKYKINNTMKPSLIMTFLCILLFIMAAVCFWRANNYFAELNKKRDETRTNCNITNYTIYQCQYDCNFNHDGRGEIICNGTAYQYYAHSINSCGNRLLFERESEQSCPQSKITDIGNIEICYIFNCDDGFHLYPPNELINIDSGGIVWITMGFIIGVCGMWCGLYAIGEYITSLGTYDFTKNTQPPTPKNRKKCCHCKQRLNDAVD